MTYEQLIALQDLAWIIFGALLCVGAVYLVLGLIYPRLVGARGRGRVIAYTLLIWFIGAAAVAGTIAYTHSRQNGPHSVNRYIDDYFAEQCAEGSDLPACRNRAITTSGEAR